MNYCVRCGSPLPKGARFCGQCGLQVGAEAGSTGAFPPAGQPPPGTFGQLPPRPHQAAIAGPAGAHAFAAGDWAGALRTVGIGVGAMLGLSLLAFLLANTGSEGGSSQLLGRIAMYTALAAGGSVKVVGGGLGNDAGLSFRPLGLTAVGFGLMGLVFVRQLRQRGQPYPSGLLVQAGRTAVVLLGALVLVALLGRTGSGPAEGAGSGVSTQVDVPATLFFGTLTLAVALAVAVALGLPGVLPDRLERFRAGVAAPLRATLLMLVAACALTLVAVVVWYARMDATNLVGATELWRRVVATLLLLLPNLAGAALLFGLGVPVTGAAGFGLPGIPAGGRGSVTVLALTDHDQLFWLWPFAAALLLLFAGYFSVRWTGADVDPRESNRRESRRESIVWFAGVLSAVLVLVSLSLSTGVWASGLPYLGAGRIGFDSLLALVYGALWGGVAALVAALTAPRRQLALADGRRPRRR